MITTNKDWIIIGLISGMLIGFGVSQSITKKELDRAIILGGIVINEKGYILQEGKLK